MALRTVGVRLTADVSNYTANIGKAAQTTKSFSQQLNEQAGAGKLDAAADAAGRMGLGLAVGFGYAVKAAADFDKQMSAVSAATHASSGELGQLRAAALQAGKDTQYSATEAAKGVTELAKAGVSTADVLGGGLKGALSLAAAGQIDVGEAAETAASAMTQFKLKGDQIPHVADLLAAAAGKAQGSVGDMSAALNQAGLIAASTGLSIEDTTGTLAAFASAGLTGSDAGTSFKTMLQALQAPSDKSKVLMEQLGISAYDTAGNFVGIANFAGQLREKLAKLTPELRANAFAQIFGSDATRAANVLYEQGAGGIQKWIGKVNDAGYASETAAKLTDNLAGDLERLKGSLETMAIEGGSGANAGLRVLTKSLGALVDEFGELPPAVGGTVTVLAGLGAVLLLGGAAWVKYRSVIAKVNAELIATGPAGEKAAAGLSKASKAAGIAGGVFLGLEVVGAVFDHFGPAATNVDKLAAALDNFSKTGQVSGELADAFGANLSGLNISANTAVSGLGGFTGAVNDLGNAIGISPVSDWLASITGTTSINKATEDMAAYDAALTQVMTTSGDAKTASDLWNAALRRSGLDTDELAKVLPDAYKKVGELNSQAMKSAGAVGALGGAEQDAAGNTAAMTEEMKKQKAEADNLEAALEKLFKQYMSADQAAIKLKETEKATNKEFRDGAKTLSLNTDEGRKNRGAILERIDSLEDMREAEIRATGKADEANAKYRDQVGALRATLKQMGFNGREIDKLVKKYEDIPPKVNTNITTTGGAAVAKQLTLMGQAQQALKKGTQVPAPLRRAFDGFARGGEVHGPGTDTSDDILALLSNDEHVWTAAEVRAAGGHQRVEDLRQAALDGELPAYARGGAVGWPYRVDVSKTRVPSAKEVAGAVTPDVPTGGRTDQFIVRVVRAAFPNLDPISTFRPGARTLSGNVSLHSLHRAVDWPASRALAEWWNAHYLRQTKEFISPWNDLNIHNGSRHTYTGAIYRQHNFAGGNAHDHIAMAGGGTIREPVMGVGASGRTYSFGENYVPERVIPNWQAEGGTGGGGTQVTITFSGPVGSRYELETWLAGAFNNLQRKGRVS